MQTAITKAKKDRKGMQKMEQKQGNILGILKRKTKHALEIIDLSNTPKQSLLTQKHKACLLTLLCSTQNLR